jgi:hypothetical protein
VTVPVLRFSRDKRGYEHFYLVQPIGRQGRSRPRILYWFRTPPNVRVGRHLFEDDTRRALETRFPDMTFEWDKLLATPIPPPDTSERWRERRRLGRTAKAATRFESDQPGEDEAAEPAVGLGAPEVEPVAARAAVDVPADAPPARAQRRRSRRGRRDRRPTDARRVGANDAAAGAAEPQEPVADRGLSDRDD